MRAVGLAALLLAALMAGCVAEEPPADEPVIDEETPDDPIPTFGPHSGLPSARPADYVPSLSAPPQWVLGEWWDIELTEDFTGGTYNVKRIVGGLEGDDYLVGMPIDAFNDEVMILHFPGFGLVDSETLGYEAHDWMFEPVQFPLEVDQTWQTYWESGDVVMTALVTEVNDETGRARIEFSGAPLKYVIYDAELGVIVEFHAPGYASYKVVDHGFDYEGRIRVPHSHDLLFFHGRIGPAGAGWSAPDAGPIETITIPDEYDRTSFSFIFFEMVDYATGSAQQFGPAPDAPDDAKRGAATMSVTAPDGTTFESTKDPTTAGHLIESYAHDTVGGDWELTIVSGGSNQVLLEGIGYVVFDVDMPEGCVVETERTHSHGGICGGHVHGIG